MDPFEASNIVLGRIRKFEPQNVANKIIGHLLMHDRTQELLRLAFGPDNLILNLIENVKIQIGLGPKTPINSPPISPSITINPILDRSIGPSSPIPSPPFWNPQITPGRQLMVNTNFNPEDFTVQTPHFLGLADQLEHTSTGISPFSSDYYYPETPFSRGPRSPSDYPIKTCHYYNKGFCKHGSKCRFIHGQTFPDRFSQMEDSSQEDQVISPGSLEKLELEISELLKTRRGSPVSIASLPMLYYEKYGRTLQAEGYLTESQRHGKAGFSLTKLLARLKNSIRLIDRPHGQHAVILAEDAQNYFETRGDRNDPGPIVNGSRQIYLTFPAESTFSEEDVAEYFSTYGPVQDVRIPCQHKRMFGFVTFANADTVRTILSKGNPHYVCGARVLVKPYREKSKLIERKYPDKFDPSMFYGSYYADLDSELHPRYESSRFLRKAFMAEQDDNIEAQIRRFSEMQIAPRSFANHSYFGYSMDELRAQEDNSEFPSAERYNHVLDVLNNESQGDNLAQHSEPNNADNASTQIDLPDNLFPPPVENSNTPTA